MSRRGPNGELSCSLVRKRCKCGKQVKAIQLTRYGVCDACIAAAKAARIAAREARLAEAVAARAAQSSTAAEQP